MRATAKTAQIDYIDLSVLYGWLDPSPHIDESCRYWLTKPLHATEEH